MKETDILRKQVREQTSGLYTWFGSPIRDGQFSDAHGDNGVILAYRTMTWPIFDRMREWKDFGVREVNGYPCLCILERRDHDHRSKELREITVQYPFFVYDWRTYLKPEPNESGTAYDTRAAAKFIEFPFRIGSGNFSVGDNIQGIVSVGFRSFDAFIKLQPGQQYEYFMGDGFKGLMPSPAERAFMLKGLVANGHAPLDKITNQDMVDLL